MERLVVSCKSENKKILGCSALDENEQDGCEYKTKRGYCAYPVNNFFEDHDDIHAVYDKLGQLEDKAEQQENSCRVCEKPSCYNCNMSAGCVDPAPATACPSYTPRNYCGNCGRKLVEQWNCKQSN